MSVVLEEMVILNGSIKHLITAVVLPGMFVNNFQYSWWNREEYFDEMYFLSLKWFSASTLYKVVKDIKMFMNL